MTSRLSRAILVLHRYLGVLVGVLMTVWCLSGFVMMYQDYPSVTEDERIAGLQPLELSGPLALEKLPFSPEEEIGGFRVEMLGDRPVLRTGGRGGSSFDLRTGEELAELSPEQVVDVAQRFAAGNGIAAGRDIPVELMKEADQWSIQPFRSAQPLYRATFNDPAGSQAYVSAASGTVVQDTDRLERGLSWIGAIPHWLYPRILRQNGPLWTEVVIWTSVIGTFLTLTGLYVGIGRISLRRKGRISPNRGVWYWHHMIGLFFGVLTLTWVFSGLLTMGPWGLLSGPPNDLRQEITGTSTWNDTRELLYRASGADLPEGTAQLGPVMLGGALYMLAYVPGAEPVRLAGAGVPAPVTEAEVRSALAGLSVDRFEYMTDEDAYHYSYKDRDAQPVFRAILHDEQQTRVYVDARTGEVVRIVDHAARQARWLRIGLHRMDFISGRPRWDIVTLLLLAGVTVVCATGAWMSFRRVSRDFKKLRRRSRTTLSLRGKGASRKLTRNKHALLP